MHVVLEKRRGKRFWDRREVLHNEIDVVQDALFDGSPVYAKVCVDCQTARQRTSKAVSQHRGNNLRGSTRVIVVQQGCEHVS